VTYQIYKNLAWLNELPPNEAESALLDCCGAQEWAERMARERPYATLEKLFQKAEDIWFDLTTVDHLEAFAAHPQIGASKPAAVQAEQAADWSAGEQARIKDAEADTREQLAEINRLYHQRFGFIFIVCASGKTAEEMLAIARARLGNSAETELRLAAEEQSKITAIRLAKLLEK
jgi:OHCU decarboxylase